VGDPGHPVGPVLNKLGRCTTALLQIFMLSSSSCVQLHIQSFNIDFEIAYSLAKAISELKQLRSFHFECNRGSQAFESSLGYLFRFLRGELPNLRHLYLPKLQMTDTATSCHRTSVHFAELLIGCPKLVYLDVSFGKFLGNAFQRIMYICEMNKSIQVLVLRKVFTNEFFPYYSIWVPMSSGRLPLLDIVFGYKNEWRKIKNSMNLFFCLNKEKRERRLLLESLHSHSYQYRQLPEVLQQLGNKHEGVTDIYESILLNRNSLKDIIVNPPMGHPRNGKRKLSSIYL
jgi:hypothetical protein